MSSDLPTESHDRLVTQLSAPVGISLEAHKKNGSQCNRTIATRFLRPMQTDSTSANNSQHCWVLMANNVASVCMGLKKFDRFQTIRNKCQQKPTLLWFHANGCNKSQQCWARLHGPLAVQGNQCHSIPFSLLKNETSHCTGSLEEDRVY